MKPEKNPNSSTEDQNISTWNNLENTGNEKFNGDAAERKSKLISVIKEKIKNNESVRKVFAMVLLAASLAVAPSAGYKQNQDKHDIFASVDNLKQNWQELKDNVEYLHNQINAGDHVSPLGINNDITPPTTIEEDQANVGPEGFTPTADPRDIEAIKQNAGDHVSPLGINNDITPPTTIEEDQANTAE